MRQFLPLPALRRSLALALVTLTLAGTSAGLAAAQEGVATPGPATAIANEVNPVAIHQGTCESPVGQPAFMLQDATPWGSSDDAPTVVGTNPGPPVAVSESEISASLDDLTTTPYVVAVHASADDYGTIVACGQIAGIERAGALVIQLAAAGDSTVSGIAVIEQNDGLHLDLGDDRNIQITEDKLDITVYLVRP